MPNEYLVDHAVRNIWCAPDQDYQSIFKPARLSPPRGSRRSEKVEWQNVPLPNQDDTFYVYQIGNVHPGFLGLFPKNGRWITAADHCNIQSMIIDVYTNMGLNFPRFEVFFAVMYDRNLIVAIKKQDNLNLDDSENAPFVRFYSNAFFESIRSGNIPVDNSISIPYLNPSWLDNLTGDRAAGKPGLVVVKGGRMNTRDQLLQLQNSFLQYNAKGYGKAYAYYNGVAVSDFNPAYYSVARFRKGDYAEFVFDSSIMQVVDYPIELLDTFTSLKDNVLKYLLHRNDQWVDWIQYEDDNDIFLYIPLDGGRWEGVFYHHNSPIAQSMVTHQDYAIPVPFVMGYTNAIPSMWDMSGIVVRQHIRFSGFQRPLVNEHQRIKELYKLKEPDRTRAMLGTNSSLLCWRADNMENELYPSFMGGDAPTSLTDVEFAYGYNAISKLVADSPLEVRTDTGQLLVNLPVGLQQSATIFEYNKDGYLLGWYPSYGNQIWVCQNATCAFIEGRIGVGSTYLSTVYNKTGVALNPDYDYTFAKVQFWDGKPAGDWQLAEEGVDYEIIDGKAHWNLDLNTWYTAIRDNSHFLTYAIDVDGTDGLAVFSIQANEDDPYGPANKVLSIPLGKLDLFLNGRALIRDVDYTIHWPQVVVWNKRYKVKTGLDRFVIRATGIPRQDADGNWIEEVPYDHGYIQYGQISHNNYYNLRDDKVQRVVVGGGVKLWRELDFPENGLGINVAGVVNGDPYAVEEVIVPIGRFTDNGTYILRDRSLARDKEVSDYMTQKLPEPPQENANPIPQRYEIYSPFVAKIMHDLNNGNLVIEGIDNYSYQDSQLNEWLKDYLYLLDYEPTKAGLDDKYVVVEPHDLYTTVTMNVWHHHFLRRAVKYFLDDKVNLSHWIELDENFVPVVPPRDI